MKKRTTFADKSVSAWMHPGETYQQAKERLDGLWKIGKHPAQQQGETRERSVTQT